MKKENFWKRAFKKWYFYGIIFLFFPIIFLILTYTLNCSGWDDICYFYFLLINPLTLSFNLEFESLILCMVSGMLQYFIVGSLIGIVIINILKLKNGKK